MIFDKYKRFIENELTIVDKKGQEVPFELNAIQKKFVENSTGRDIILKARQQGFSSFTLAAFTADFILKENSLSVVVADNANNAQDLLSRVKWYIKAYEEKNGIKVPLKYNSKYELANAATGSRYIIGTAENTEFGRSKTITNLHLSEAAFFPHFQKLLASAGSAVVPDGKFIVETTANGFNEFRDWWNQSVNGETGFTAHFFKASDFYSPEFLEGERKRLGRLFSQEYPETAQEAFITSGNQYFDRESLQNYLKQVKKPMEVMA